MKSPRLIRPLMMLGVFVMVLALLSYGMLPGWRSSAWGVILLIAGVVLGLAAIIKDMIDLIREVRRIEEEQKQNKKE
jgi:hypothetical protein